MKIKSLIDGPLALVICAVLWSTGGIFIKNIEWNGLAIAGIRSLISGTFMLLVTRQGIQFFVRDQNGRRDNLSTILLWLAALSYASTMILFVVANKLTTSANAILLQYTCPIYIILLAPLLTGEKNRGSDYITVLGVMLGIILFFADGLESGNQLGNILAALSGLSYALATIFMRRCKGNSGGAMVLSHLITALVCLPFVIQSGMPSPKSTFFLLMVGTVSIGIPSILYSVGIKKVRALTASFITMLEPLLNPVWVIIFAGEVPSVKTILGGVLILGFIMIRSVVQNRKMM
ncbi:Putative permease, DMT superfamily [Treponema sp. JC4]|uniref:DMT family transporter n=1 Tax=Treponema sp. JC4 TaxID=1124982 RepID=UPI00025AFBE0|nr:DMT family transporter [Treponema sp. JC4]EID85100.1 Putative permease, DMT superfamily [Treponema sp. JC4]